MDEKFPRLPSEAATYLEEPATPALVPPTEVPGGRVAAVRITSEEYWGVKIPVPPDYEVVPLRDWPISGAASLFKGIHEGKINIGKQGKDMVDQAYAWNKNDDYEVAHYLLTRMNAGSIPSLDIPLHKSDGFLQQWKIEKDENRRQWKGEPYIEQSPYATPFLPLSIHEKADYMRHVSEDRAMSGSWLADEIKGYVNRSHKDYRKAAQEFTNDLLNRKFPELEPTEFMVTNPERLRMVEQRGKEEDTKDKKPKVVSPPPKTVVPPVKSKAKELTPSQKAVQEDLKKQETWGSGGVGLGELNPSLRDQLYQQKQKEKK